jgi:hypothetical protein
MDALSALLKKEIDKKKKKVEELKNITNEKYVRSADLEKLELQRKQEVKYTSKI